MIEKKENRGGAGRGQGRHKNGIETTTYSIRLPIAWKEKIKTVVEKEIKKLKVEFKSDLSKKIA